MGRHKRRKRSKRSSSLSSSSSSSSSSSGDDIRRTKRHRRSGTKEIRPTSSGGHEVRYVGRNDAIPEFDPQKSAVSMNHWVRNIESIATMYGWDERTTICNCTAKLRGYAKAWYERLEDYNISWSDWKARLIRAFPFTKNKLTMLRSLVNDIRKVDEDPIKFYYEKLGLGMSCGLPDNVITETIIGTMGDKMIEVGAVSAGCQDTITLLMNVERKRMKPQKLKV